MNNRDIYRQLEAIVRSHRWRRERLAEAKEKRTAIAEQIAASRFAEITGGRNIAFSDPTPARVAKFAEFDKFIEENERLTAAVEEAFAEIGKEYGWEERRDMRTAFLLNFENPNKYPWQNLDYKKGRQHFFKHRRIFLRCVGHKLGMLPPRE